ncbi:MAG: hypothetical protein ABJP48_13515 [Erythrobacter sp.]
MESNFLSINNSTNREGQSHAALQQPSRQLETDQVRVTWDGSSQCGEPSPYRPTNICFQFVVKEKIMPKIKVAHIIEQGQNMILFPLDRTFHQKTSTEQHTALAELEDRAHEAGLAGRAAVFWEVQGRTHYLGPRQWTNFLRSISIRQVLASVNKSITW